MRESSTSIDYLEEFAYLADTLSFKRTADHFYVSRSVISRHIAALEESIGVRLVDRGGRAVALTEAGRVFYREAKVILRDWGHALERVRGVAHDGGQLVRIGYLRNAARPVLVQFVRHMADAHPGTKLSLACMEYDELRQAMDDGAVDIALAVNVHPSISRQYRSTRVYEDSFYAVCSRNHPLTSHTEGVRLDDLRDCKLLLPDSYVYSGLSDYIDELVDEKTQLVAQAFYRDVDMLFLKVQTEDYVAFSSGMNNAMFENELAILPIIDVDMRFLVSAFYNDELDPGAFAACSEGFEWCRDAIKHHRPGITLKPPL